MKIAIIGAGWVGCHLASKLMNDHEVVVYESEGIFSQTSYKNQNRLHLGYHYARSSLTRDLCINTFNKFLEDYPSLISDIENNIYVVPNDKSIIDFKTYLKIFDYMTHDLVNLMYLNNIEGAIRVNERFIDPFKSKKYFIDLLKNNIVYKIITEEDLRSLALNNDLVINATNNVLSPILEDVKYELCEVLVYKKVAPVEFGALTFVDGDLFSIFPYQDDLYTVTQVNITPNQDLTTEQKRKALSKSIEYYYSSFNNDFKFHHSFKSYKVKNVSSYDSRIPRIIKNDNIITTFTGKIQGIYQIEEYVLNQIKELKSGNT